jgi:hypothetical protein
MYHVYETIRGEKYRITSAPISLNWLMSLFASLYIPRQVPFMKPTECITIDNYLVVKVD